MASKIDRKKRKKGGRARAGVAGGSRAAAGPRPLTVTQGAKSHQTVGIHWITCTAPMACMGAARRVLERLVGGDVEPGGGGDFYRRSLRWEAGASIMLEHVGEGVDSCMVKVPGSVLDELGFRKSCELLHALMASGFRCTRLDVCVDARAGKWRNLQAQIMQAWQRREVCGIKAPPMEWIQHRLDGQQERTVALGRRGRQGSGRYVRVYDKGFEDGTESRQGEHVRWEAELSEDCAQMAAHAIMEAWDGDDDDDGTRAGAVAAGVALACVDFREANGRRDISRRPRLAWWSEVVEGLKLLRVVAERSATTLAGFVQHFRQAQMPKLCRMAGVERITDPVRDLEKIVGVMLRLGVEGVRASRGDAVTWAFKRDGGRLAC